VLLPATNGADLGGSSKYVVLFRIRYSFFGGMGVVIAGK